MTREKVLEVIEKYHALFEELRIQFMEIDHGIRGPSREQQLSHCASMLPSMEAFIASGQMEKVFRWLGFLQGVLWTNSAYTLEELRNHNRSTL